MNQPFLRIFRSLNTAAVRYVVVGGFAAVMHGNNRFTADVDLIIDLNPVEARKAIEAILSLGFKSRIPVDPFHFADPVERNSWVKEKNMKVFSFLDPTSPLFAVDIFADPPMEFEALYDRSLSLTFEDVEIRICSLDDLIEMKQRSGRPQDLLDIENLQILKAKRTI